MRGFVNFWIRRIHRFSEIQWQISRMSSLCADDASLLHIDLLLLLQLLFFVRRVAIVSMQRRVRVN